MQQIHGHITSNKLPFSLYSNKNPHVYLKLSNEIKMRFLDVYQENIKKLMGLLKRDLNFWLEV